MHETYKPAERRKRYKPPFWLVALGLLLIGLVGMVLETTAPAPVPITPIIIYEA